MRPVVAVVVAAGRSRRMGVNKMLLEAHGRPVLAWTLEVFERHPRVERIYVTASEEDLDSYRDLVAREGLSKVAAVVVGGAERQESVYRALQHVRDNDSHPDPLVAIHDGARPLLTARSLDAVLAAAQSFDGALLCVPAKETLKRVIDGMVRETVPREQMMVAQTPQVFPLRAMLEAHEEALRDGFAATDDAMLMERRGVAVHVVVGDYDNIKVTTPEDVVMMERILERRHAGAAHG